MVYVPVVSAAPDSTPPTATNKSDLNRDGIIDYDDLVLFSSEYLEQDVETIDWCAFYREIGRGRVLHNRPGRCLQTR